MKVPGDLDPQLALLGDGFWSAGLAKWSFTHLDPRVRGVAHSLLASERVQARIACKFLRLPKSRSSRYLAQMLEAHIGSLAAEKGDKGLRKALTTVEFALGKYMGVKAVTSYCLAILNWDKNGWTYYFHEGRWVACAEKMEAGVGANQIEARHESIFRTYFPD